MAEVVWLASYPKSGNTWVRALLAGYVGEGAFDLDNLAEGVAVHGLRTLDRLLGVDPLLLRPGEREPLRPAAARVLARDVQSRPTLAIHKIHDANVVTAAGEPAFPADAGRALYVARNPLDVAASWAPFFGMSTGRAIRALGDPGCVLNDAGGAYQPTLPETLLSWSGHVASWLDAPGLAVHLVRYEDLLADTAGTFARALEFIGEPVDARRLEAAVTATRFDRLQAREAADGFVENSRATATPFFRRGRAGGWRDELTAAEARRVVAAHRATMLRLGYADVVAEVEAAARGRERSGGTG